MSKSYVDADWDQVKMAMGLDNNEWKKRTVAMAAFLDGRDKAVMDLSAGNMYLGKLLGNTGGSEYIPVDMEKTSPRTIVCDFNNGQFPDRKVDVIFAAGIIGYINDPWWFLEKIAGSCSKLIISHKGKEKYDYAHLFSYEIKDYLYKKGFVLTGEDKSLPEWTMIACFQKLSPEVISKNLLCTGCGACANVCPVDALAMDYDKPGFLKPSLDHSKCINCGKCISVCDALQGTQKKKRSNEVDVYAAWASDDIRANSSSGGAFSVFAKDFIDRHGVVFGAAFDENFRLMHKAAYTEEDLDALRHSKYMQSDTMHTFREVRDLLNQHIPVLYVGTHCQIAGLKNYLQELSESELLLTASLLCFGAPSNVVFRRYLKETYGEGTVTNVEFRNKERLGWSPYGYKVSLKNSEDLYPKFEDDVYQKIFHRQYFRNDVCENCRYTDVPMEGDITIGDFWGIDAHDKTWNDGKGTSIIMANSHKGKKYMASVIGRFDRIESVPTAWMLNNGNAINKIPRKRSENYSYFMYLLDHYTIAEAYEMASAKYHNVGIVLSDTGDMGGHLSNFMLYRFLKQHGYLVAFICSTGGVRNLFMQSSLIPQYDILTVDEAKDNPGICTVYVTGSGLQWDSEDYGITALSWLTSDKYKMSCATVAYEWNDATKQNTEKAHALRYYLKRYQKVSVSNEELARDMEKDLGTICQCVTDPLFFADGKFYEELSECGRITLPDGKYVSVCLSDSSALDKNLLHIPNMRLCDNSDNSTAEEWIAHIGHSDCVITDSYCAVCLAIRFHKQFAAISSTDSAEYGQISGLLSSLHLEKRIVDNAESINDLLLERIDWDQADAVLYNMTAASQKWLLESVDEGMNYDAEWTTYDAFISQIYQARCDMDELQEEIEKMRKELAEEKKQNYRERLELYASLNMPITTVFYGVGNGLARNLNAIREIGDFGLVCDTCTNYHGKTFYDDFLCISPDALGEYSNLEIVITAIRKETVEEIKRQLTQMGYGRVYTISEWLFMRGVAD